MKKRMTIMLIGLGILFGIIFIYKVFTATMLKRYLASNRSPIITVSAMKVEYSLWQPQLKASASLRAIRGVNVTAELAGMVKTIYFTPGDTVKKDTILVQLNVDADVAQLHSLQANAELAHITLQRDQIQYAAKAISKATLDSDEANRKSLDAQVAQQVATVAKKIITAPFDGRLGISAVNPGQYVNPGDKVVTLQTLDPIYADFYVPQQTLVQLKVGQVVTLTDDTFPGEVFMGRITTIDPLVDVNTRNAEIEATITNPKYALVPGMFATVNVATGAPQRYLTLPQTAISYNPYGDIVYIIRETGKDAKGQPVLTVTQRFVITGETRGDQVIILQGLKEGDAVVTSGQLKLKNGSQVVINNTIIPTNNPAPSVTNES